MTGEQGGNLEEMLQHTFESLGTSVERIRTTRDRMARAGLSQHPHHLGLYERIDTALVAARNAYSEVVRDANLGLRGEEVIETYCARVGYADFVVDRGLDYLVPSWERDVREIETGYKGLVEEYWNDMDGRRILYEVWPLASADQVARYQRRIEEADRKFFAATIPAEGCIRGRNNEAKYGYHPEVDWWYYRVPVVKGPNW